MDVLPDTPPAQELDPNWPPGRIANGWMDLHTFAFPAGFAWNEQGIITIQFLCFGLFINVTAIIAYLPTKGAK